MSKSWQCPFCLHHSSIDHSNVNTGDMTLNRGTKHGDLYINFWAVTCPNPDCKEFTIEARMNELKAAYPSIKLGSLLKTWKLKPQSCSKPLPDYIPQAIKEDYEEACSILNLSPKASATLARRCLQGMIRSFWEVKPQNLAKEIESIKDKVEPDTWEAIDVVRKVGNIGAHMEKDINQIVEVDENEAGLLIGLIEMLIEEWYVSRYERQQRLEKIKQLGQNKDDQRKKKAEPIISD